MLRNARGRIMEIAYYRVEPLQRIAFLRLMNELHHVRGRAGAVFWQVYEDVAHPEGWVEVWSMESWTDHLREAIRLSEDDKRLLAAVAVFQHEADRPSRYLAVDPQEYLHAHSSGEAARGQIPNPRSFARLRNDLAEFERGPFFQAASSSIDRLTGHWCGKTVQLLRSIGGSVNRRRTTMQFGPAGINSRFEENPMLGPSFHTDRATPGA